MDTMWEMAAKFWKEMSSEDNASCDDVTKYFERMEATGSRVICNPPPTDTDQDFLCLVDWDRLEDADQLLCSNGFEVGGSEILPPAEIALEEYGTFFSYKKGDINYILTCSEEFFDKMMEATRQAKALNLMDKQARIDLFQRVVYNNFK